ncbi:MAG: clostripain [Selenomonadaceae bacterium]|nr:clostripain [Selenomonadaceae bacterium]
MLVTLVFASACSDSGGEQNSNNTATNNKSTTSGGKSAVSFGNDYKKDDTWLVYWYLCGTDLESGNGAATLDLSELVEVQLPPNVKVLIQTGGTTEWQNEVIPDGQITRLVYDNEDLKILQELPDADMGSQSTLVDFLKYGKDNFQADHRVFVFWDHGGGSVYGICSDERTGNALSLNDLTQAFGKVYQADADKPPFEIIGFDACLMATYDTAASIYGFCRYMVGSEEVEPGNGWNYTGWVGALAKNPAMGGAALGKSICDTFMQGCEEYQTDDAATLSVVDMSKIPRLNVAYEYFGLEAVKSARRDVRGFFSTYGRGAQRAENYGGNTRQSGYFNMVDLADLAKQSQKILPSTYQNLIAAIDDAVVYKVHGDYRAKGSGLSGFYSYDGGEESLVGYLNIDAAPFSQKVLYYYLIYGELPDEAAKVIDDGTFEKTLAQVSESLAQGTPEPAPPAEIENAQLTQPAPAQRIDNFSVSSLEDLPVNVDDNGSAFVKLTPEQMDLLSSVHCQLTYISVEDDIILYLGSDANIDANWDTGIFKDNFQAVWPTLDGHLVYMEIVSEDDDYNLYNVPIKLNGVECNLQVVYSYKDEKYHILGARKGIDDNGMADRTLIKLKAGDQITTIHYGTLISSDDDDLIPVDVDTFTISSANPEFKDEDTGDGIFGYCFEFVSPTDDSALSQMVTFTVKGDEITTSVE